MSLDIQGRNDDPINSVDDRSTKRDLARRIVYHRWTQLSTGALERFIVVLNFSGFDQWVDIPFSVNGTWKDLLNGSTSTVSTYRLTNERITSNWGRIYAQRSSYAARSCELPWPASPQRHAERETGPPGGNSS